MPTQKNCSHLSRGSTISKNLQYHLGILRLSLMGPGVFWGFGWEPLFGTSFNLDSADDGISDGISLPHAGDNGVLLTSLCRGRASRVAPLLFPVLIPLRPSLSAPRPCSEALLGAGGMLHPALGRSACTHGKAL